MAFIWQNLEGDPMAFCKDTQVQMMMGFSSVADKIQETDRLRGYENTYITVTSVEHVVMDGVLLTLEDNETLLISDEQMVLTVNGWKKGKDIQLEEWLCGKEEDVYVGVKEITKMTQQDMVILHVVESGSMIANGVVLGIYA